MKYRTDLATAAQVFERAFQHVSAFGCRDLACHDDPDERRVGVFCRECSVWYNAPIPGPGEFTDWPWDMTNPGSAVARRAYLAQQVDLAYRLRPPREKTAWDFVLGDVLESGS